jgi:glycosyltransferase involved in cell wall biosynthesis
MRGAASLAQPRISVVIPTTGRPSLVEAVESALAQTLRPLEVVAVYDLDHIPAEVLPGGNSVRVVHTGGARGANAARQLGIDLARGDVIALLDDDDRWLPTKLEEQSRLLLRARQQHRLGVIGAAMTVVDERGRDVRTVPRRLIAEGQGVADYLFKRRELPYGEATLNSSSLLIERELFQRVPLDTSLSVHQDWDWLLRAARDDRVSFAMVASPQLLYRAQPQGMALSRPRNWVCSMQWVEQRRVRLTTRQYGDFLAGVTLPMAVDAGDRCGALSVLARSVRHGRPGPAAMAVAIGSLMLPRTLTDRLAGLWQTLAGGHR